MIDAVQQCEYVDPFESSSSYDWIEWDGYCNTMFQETILRFPETSVQDRLDWSLARWEGEHGYSEWINTPEGFAYPTNSVSYFVLLLESGLNSGAIKLDSLADDLDGVGFSLQERQATTNLFGDGQPAEVLLVCVKQRACALLALTGSYPGEYHLFPLHKLWQWNYSSREPIVIVDHNGNGRPEIWSSAAYLEKKNCSSEFALYEWNDTLAGAQFVNIAANVPPVSIWLGTLQECTNAWRFESANEGGSHPLVKMERYPNWIAIDNVCLPLEVWTRYEWNEAGYEQVSQEVIPYDSTQPAECAWGWAGVAAEHGLYDRAIPSLSAMLQDWPARADEIWGPAARDYFRFKLGTWYALLDQPEQARAALEMVRDDPSNPDFDTASQWAETYLAHYAISQDPYYACSALHHSLTFPADKIAVWGFADPLWNRFCWYRPSEDCICDPDAAQGISQRKLGQSLRNFTPQSTAALEQWFAAREIPIWAIESADLTRDGRDDWLVFIGPDGNAVPGLWVLIAGKEGLVASQVSRFYAYSTAQASISLGYFTLAQDGSLMVSVIQDNGMDLFRIAVQSDAIQTERIFSTYNVSSYEASTVNGETELLVQNKAGSVEKYVWYPAGYYNLFERPSRIEERNRTVRAQQTIESIEQAFFPAGDIPQMIELLEPLLVEEYLADTVWPGRSEERARFFYLLGLACELTGDEEGAVQAYQQLVNEYPESPFVLVVRRKLELVEGKP